ncbi:MAG: helix-turn-helix domain-containing protein [Gammaproteobacteria bacterium]
MTLNEALVAVIRQLVDDRGMTYTGLARVSGVSHNSLQNYVTRERGTIPLDFAEDLAEKGFGMTLFDLLRLAQEKRGELAPP